MWDLKAGLILFLSDIMIVYKRNLKKSDVQNLDDDDELIYYYNSNIAYIVNHLNDSYIIRKKKIFNNELVEERILKTVEQILRFIPE